MREEHIIGNTCENQRNIEKNEILMVYLTQDKCENEFIQLISDIKNGNVDFDELKTKLSNKYGITMDDQMMMEVNQMCNYGSYVFNEGKKEGKIEGKIESIIELIVKKMRKKNIPAIDAMIEMDIDEADFNIYLPYVEKELNIVQ